MPGRKEGALMKRTVATLAVVLLFPVANARADVVGLASSVIDFGQVSFSGIQIDILPSSGFLQYRLPGVTTPEGSLDVWPGSEFVLSSDIGGGQLHTVITGGTSDESLFSSVALNAEGGRARPLSDANLNGSFLAKEAGFLTITVPFDIDALALTELPSESALAVAYASIALAASRSDFSGGLDSRFLELGVGPEFGDFNQLRLVHIDNFGPTQVAVTDLGPGNSSHFSGVLAASMFFNEGQSGAYHGESLSIAEVAVPEPATSLLVGLGLAMVGYARLRARSRKTT